MNSNIQTITGQSLQRRLILDCIVRWRWSIVMVFIIHMLIALMLLSLDDRDGFPVLILLTGCYSTGTVFFVYDFKNGWFRVLKALPLPHREANRMLRFTILLPVAIWIVVILLVTVVSLFCGLSFGKLTPLLCALVYGAAASAVALYYAAWKYTGRTGSPHKIFWLLLLVLIPCWFWFTPVGHPFSILSTLPLWWITFIGWRELREPAMAPQSRHESLMEKPAPPCCDKVEVFKKGSCPLIKWLLKRMMIGFFVGCCVSAYSIWSVQGEPGGIENWFSDERLIFHLILVIALTAVVVAAASVPAIRLWRSLPLPENVLTVVLTSTPAGAALAAVLGVIVPPVVGFGFKFHPSPHNLTIGSLSLLLCFTAAPMTLRYQGRNGSQFMSLLLFFIVNIVVSVLIWSRNYNPLIAIIYWGAAIPVLIYMIIRMRHLLKGVLAGASLGSLAIISLIHQSRYLVFTLILSLGIAVFGLVWMRRLLSQNEIYRNGGTG